LAFGLGVVWMFREAVEGEFGEQIVTVVPGKIIWAIKTRWWTRQRELSDLQEISAVSQWDGVGRVVLKARGRQYVVFQRVLREEAIRLANELKHAVRR